MGEGNNQKSESLPLDPDKSGHMALIPESIHAQGG